MSKSRALVALRMKKPTASQARRKNKPHAQEFSPRAQLLLERARAISGADIDAAAEAMRPILGEVIFKIGTPESELTLREADAINREATRIGKEMRATLREMKERGGTLREKKKPGK